MILPGIGLGKKCKYGAFARHNMFSLAVASLLTTFMVSPRSLYSQQCTSTRVEVGYRTIDYSQSRLSQSATEEKPESKLWWNDGFWWGMLWDPSDDVYKIHRFDVDNQCWVNVGPDLDKRPKSSSDVFWDEESGKLYVSSRARDGASGDKTAWFFRYSYHSDDQSYSRDSGFPVEINEKRSESLVITKDSSGKIWATWEENQKIMVSRTTGSDKSWGVPFQLPVQGKKVDKDDLSCIISFDGDKIGIMWSNQLDQKIYFAVHHDGDPDTEWQPAEEALADKKLGNVADDHLNLATNNRGTVVAVTKTSLNPNAEPQIYLLKRDPDGVWSRHVFGLGSDNHTRPIVLVNSDNDSVYVISKAKTSPVKVYIKRAHLSNPNFKPGFGEIFIHSKSDRNINDPTSTKQSLNSKTGLLVIASDKSSEYYVHNYFSLRGDAPVISSVTPSAGVAGTEVTLIGRNFGDVMDVEFDGKKASSFTIDSGTRIRATAPSGAKTGPIRVTDSEGGNGTSASDFIVILKPTIASFTPAEGSAGDEVTITGSRFIEVSGVKINGIAASIIEIDLKKRLRVELPLGATTGTFTVTNPAGTGTSGENFIVRFFPRILSVTPANGPVGTEVTLSGANFGSTKSVTFQEVAATFVIESETELRAEVPAGAATGKIRVTNDDGETASEEDFAVILVPAITSFSPETTYAGSQVTITGGNFLAISSVQFSGVSATSFTVDSETQVRAEVPIGAVTGQISVTNPAGTATSSNELLITHPPRTLTFFPDEDAFVWSAKPTSNYGASNTLRARKTNSSTRYSFLKFAVAGIAGSVQSAKLRLTVRDASGEGGRIYLVSNFYKESNQPWLEQNINWNNAPELSKPALSSIGAVKSGEIVEFDVTAAIAGSGTYSFGIENSSSDAVYYVSRDGGSSPELVIETSTTPVPLIASFRPKAGPVGTEVTLTGANFIDVTRVAFGGTPVLSFTVDSQSQLRAEVPPGASSGKITLINEDGESQTSSDFEIVTLPTITAFEPASGPVDSEVTVTGRDFDDVTGVQFNGSPASDFTLISGNQLRAKVPAAANTGKIRLTTAVGAAESNDIFTVLRSPAIAFFEPTSGIQGTEVSIAGSDFGGVTEVLFNGVPASSFTASDTEISAIVPDEARTGPIELRNAVGAALSNPSFTVIRVPVITSIEPSSGVVGSEVTLTGSDFAGISEVLFNGLSSTEFTSVSDVEVRATVPAAATSGQIVLSNAAGTGKSPGIFTVVNIPSIVSFEPQSGVPGSEVTLTGTHFDEVSELMIGGVTVADFSADSGTRLRATIPANAKTGKIVAKNTAGSSESRTDFLVIEPPTVTALSPTMGGIGIEIRITGTNLAGVTEVSVGGAASTFIVDSDTLLRVEIPPAASTGKITVTNPAGSDESLDDFIVIAAPIIKSFTPEGGLAGTEVTITGSHFTTATDVTFAGSAASTFILDSDSQLRAEVPTSAISGKIAVATAGGEVESEVDFKVLFPPAISSFAPKNGLAGDEVTVLGSGFEGVTSVAFGAAEASDFVTESDTRLRVLVPSDAKSGKIQVTGASVTTQSPYPFRVIESPDIATFTPASGPAGSEITISGLNFADILNVKVSGVSAASFTVDSDSRIRAVIPAGDTNGPVEVTNRAGSSTSSSDFIITAPQSVFSFQPTDDSFVHSKNATKNYGTSDELRVRQSSAKQQAYFKFKVAGLTSSIVSASLRLHVLEGSDDGGELYLVSNTYDGSKVSWDEKGLKWKNAPTISGKRIKTLGAVKTGKTLKLNVKSVISGNGVYSFGIKNSSSQVVRFDSKEGGQAPELIIEVDVPVPVLFPGITSFSPHSGTAGAEVTIRGFNLGSVTEVSFNGTAASNFTIDSDTQVRAIVPAGATTGLITVTDSNGAASTLESFVVAPTPTIVSFSPASGLPGSEVTILGKHFTDATSVAFNGVQTPNFSVESDTKILAAVPESATKGKITVKSATGTAISKTKFSVDSNQPVITSLSPSSGTVGTEVTIAGVNLSEVTAVWFNGVSVSTFSIDSDTQLRAQVPNEATSGPVSVISSSGVGISPNDFSLQTASGNIVLKPIHDTFVYSTRANRNYGRSDELRVRETSSGTRASYLKFDVTGLSGPPKKATLRLKVINGSNDGGSVYVVSNNYAGSSKAWKEEGLLWPNAPVLAGNPLAAIGSVSLGETVEIDVTSVISGNGFYSFGIRGGSSDAVKYSSKEGVEAPELVISEGPPALTPSITSVKPTQGGPNTEVTLAGSNFIGVTAVSVGGTPAPDFTIDSASRLRFSVPAGAASGRISLTSSEGSGQSAEDFLVLRSPEISSLAPTTGPVGTEVTLKGIGFTGVTDVRFDGVPAQSIVVTSDFEIRAIVPSAATTGTVSVTNDIGTDASLDVFAIVAAPSKVTFSPTHDTIVRSAKPTSNYGSSDELRVRKTSKESNVYLKFTVNGLVGSVKKAKIRLHVLDGSGHGGDIYSVSNLLAGTGKAWKEGTLIWTNAPAISGSALHSLGAISPGKTVEFDVTDAITGDGTYSFAIKNKSADVAIYSSKEGAFAPELFITLKSPLAKSSSTSGAPDGIEPEPVISVELVPTTLAIQANYPNPFNISTTFEYGLPDAGQVRLAIYNLRGQEVLTLVDGHQTAGFKKVLWNGRNHSGLIVGSGVFFVRLQFGGKNRTRMITLQK